MKEATSRRLFLQKTAMATTGLALISTNVVSAFATETPYDGYNPYSEEKTDIRTTIFGNHIKVKGIIYDSQGTAPLPNATVEVWHLSPNSQKFRHRTRITTNEQGAYQFITDQPNKESGKNRRIYFKVTSGEETRFTELVVHEHNCYITSQHWLEQQQLGNKLFPTTKKNGGTTVANFNISI